jgi:L-alanine-DL-glutamate epimerase-like enolase superfamily enzyme
MAISEITLHRMRLTLPKPYKVAFKTYTSFDPILVEIQDDSGRIGWGEAHIPEGYSAHETPEHGLNFCRARAAAIVGLSADAAKAEITRHANESPMATTALITALEMLETHPILKTATETRIPLLANISAKSIDGIPDEVEQHLNAGFATIKLKVGFDVDDDLNRARACWNSIAGRATFRMDANRNYSTQDALSFVHGLPSEGIELLEQPCDSEDWEANAIVAAASPVPIMLDESIYTIDDVEKAGNIKGVDFVKMKLKRAGGLEKLNGAMKRAEEIGMTGIVGDGVASEIGNWMEARSTASLGITAAGEGNGFLKTHTRLLANPLPFENGEIVLPPNYWPEIDRDALDAHRSGMERFTAPR